MQEKRNWSRLFGPCGKQEAAAVHLRRNVALFTGALGNERAEPSWGIPHPAVSAWLEVCVKAGQSYDDAGN